MFGTLLFLMMVVLWLVETVPAGWVDVISVIVGLVITLALKFGPIPSRVVAVVGVVAGLFGAFGGQVVSLFPSGSRIPFYIAVFGVVIAAISERIQGGITVPEKRVEAMKAEQKGETF
jgi:hypothetical protein